MYATVFSASIHKLEGNVELLKILHTISIKVRFYLSSMSFFAVHKAANIKLLCHFILRILQMDREFVHKEYASRNILPFNPNTLF
jgi:hypothetical protein